MKKLVCLVAVSVVFAGMNDAFARGGRGGGGFNRGGGAKSFSSRGGSSRGGSSRNFSPQSSPRPSSRNFNRPGQGNFPNNAQNLTDARPGTSGVRSNISGQTARPGDVKNFLNLSGGPQGSPLSETFKSRSPFEQGAAFGERGSKFTEMTGKQPGEQFDARSEQFQGKKEDFQGKFATAKSDKKQAWSDKKSEWSDKANDVADQVRNEYEELTNDLDQTLAEELHDAYHDHYDDWAYMYEQYPGYFWLQAAQWGAIGALVLDDAVSQPYAYNYGTSVYTEGGTVYYEGEPVAATEEYAEEAYQIADARPEEAPADIQWMPLGMYAVKTTAESSSQMMIQLSVSQEGYLIGTYYNQTTESAIPIEGTVDKSTQRAAWKLADGLSPMVMETGIYDLTQDQTVVLVHFGTERTEEWLLVRLHNPEADAKATAAATN